MTGPMYFSDAFLAARPNRQRTFIAYNSIVVVLLRYRIAIRWYLPFYLAVLLTSLAEEERVCPHSGSALLSFADVLTC